MSKFKVGDKVEHVTRGEGVVVELADNQQYSVRVIFDAESGKVSFTEDGRYEVTERPSLRLTGRQFNLGDRVVIGEKNGVIDFIICETDLISTRPIPVRVDMGVDNVWITTDGRAWPGTPIICEHDWEGKTEKAINKLGESAKNCGVLGNWPVDDVTVSPEEVRHIAEMQEHAKTEADQMPKYVKMALALEGIEVDLKTADLIREIVYSVNAHGGQYDLDTSCNIHQKIEEKYVQI